MGLGNGAVRVNLVQCQAYSGCSVRIPRLFKMIEMFKIKDPLIGTWTFIYIIPSIFGILVIITVLARFYL